MQPIQTGCVIGDYRVIGIAGIGGMGAVFKIEHVITKRIEAMKLLALGAISEPDQVERFEREIQVQARLHHPNIVTLYNAVRDGDSIALVMEYVEGESLQHMLEAGPLPFETAADFACQVLRALAYAHEAGVIHRDVSPANIIVTPERTVKLTDFGLARGAADRRLTKPGEPLGSFWYTSPEQVRGSDALDVRTDIYAMGAVLHEMLTGGKLFEEEEEGAFAVMRAHVERQPAPPSSRNPSVPAAFDEVVGKALAKDPAMRFQTADEFRQALETTVASARLAAPMKSLAALSLIPWRLRGFHPSRATAAMAMTLVVLTAGFCAVRFSPGRAAGKRATASQSHVAVTAAAHDLPPATAAAEVPDTAPALATVPTVVKEKPAAKPRRRVQQPPPPVDQAERSNAIRIIGSEWPKDRLPVVDPVPPRAAVPTRAAETPAPCEPKADLTQASVAAAPADPAAASDPSTAAQDAASAKSQKGNRFVRALAKVNPFRKKTAQDTAATNTQLKKN